MVLGLKLWTGELSSWFRYPKLAARFGEMARDVNGCGWCASGDRQQSVGWEVGVHDLA